MNINAIDASNYFRGLLLLIGKDNEITKEEVVLLKRIGKALGFEKDFCDNAICDLLENEHIVETLPVFSSVELAKKFIVDGFTLAAADEIIHHLEEEWLKSTAKNNGLSEQWCSQVKATTLERKTLPARLEVEDLILENSHYSPKKLIVE